LEKEGMDHTFLRKFKEIPPNWTVILLTGVAAVATVIIFLMMRPTEEALKAASSYGVMELEFAWTIEQVDIILSTWAAADRDLITQELNVTLLDYVFLVAYSTFFAGIALLTTRRLLTERIETFGLYMTLAPFVAALFDAMENVNLLLMLSSPSNYPPFSPFLTSFVATLKFGLLILTTVFLIGGVVLWIYQRISSQSD
jgi:hypothetical protein